MQNLRKETQNNITTTKTKQGYTATLKLSQRTSILIPHGKTEQSVRDAAIATLRQIEAYMRAQRYAVAFGVLLLWLKPSLVREML